MNVKALHIQMAEIQIEKFILMKLAIIGEREVLGKDLKK
jgi:hypothetical protein